uniref:Virilizer N-terminal domain-containing protein n=1 Tax=Octopus bimaculoides TaxID=37653 RepID=A0A0L8HH29_OCTBM
MLKLFFVYSRIRLEYKDNKDVMFLAEELVPTNGLILKGWYTTITIAAFGNVATIETISPPPPPPPPQQSVHRIKGPALENHSQSDKQSEWEPRQQHPLDYIQQQVEQQMQQLQQQHAQQQAQQAQQQQQAQAQQKQQKQQMVQPSQQPKAVQQSGQGQTQVPPPSSQQPSSQVQPSKQPQQQQQQQQQQQVASSQQQQQQQKTQQPSTVVHPPSQSHTAPTQTPLLPLPHRSSDVYHQTEELFDHRPSSSQDIPTQEYSASQREFTGDSHKAFSQRDSTADQTDRTYRGDFNELCSESKEPIDTSDFFEEQHRSRSSYEREVHHRDGRGTREADTAREFDNQRDGSREKNDKDPCSRSPTRERDWDQFKERDQSRDLSDRETRDRTKSPHCRSRSPTRSRSPPAESPRQDRIEDPDSETLPMNQDDLYCLTPVHSPNVIFLSDAENQDADDGYEDISSDDDDDGLICGDDSDMQNVEFFDVADDSWNFATSSFNPFQCYLAPLAHFLDPSLTPFEVEKAQWQQSESGANAEMCQEAKTLLEFIETFANAEHQRKWIEAVEIIPSLLDKGLSYLLYKENREDVLTTLLDWCIEGLDLKKAITQPETAFKVRYLKMGIRLASSLCCCDSFVASKAVERNIQHYLLDLYISPNMSMSLKLQILRALDQTTRLQEGLLWFTASHPSKQKRQRLRRRLVSAKQNEENEDTTEKKMYDIDEYLQDIDDAEQERDKKDGMSEGWSCYQRLLDIMMTKQIVRVAVAGTALLRKIHTFEVLQNFYLIVEQLIENMPCFEEGDLKSGQEDVVNGGGGGGGGGGGSNNNGSGGAGGTEDNDVDPVASGVASISDVNADLLITYLEEITKVMTQAPFLIAQPRRSLPGKVIFELRQQPLDIYPNLFSVCYSCQLLECLFVLLSSPATINNFGLFVAIRDFLQQLLETQKGLLFLSAKPDATNGILRALVQMGDYNREENSEENPAQLLGLQLTYHLQTLQYVDQLADYHKKSDEVKDARVKKSVCAGYVSELLLLVIRQSDNMEMLQRFAPQLLAISEDGKYVVNPSASDQMATKMQEIQEWLCPIKKITSFSHEVLQSLILQLKMYADDVLKLPRGLITILRVLNFLAVPPKTKYAEERPVELKYSYIIIELLSADCFRLFVVFLQRLADRMQRPWQQGIPQSSSQLSIVLSIVKPALSIINTTLSFLIMSRESEVSTLPVLLELHTVICSVPSAAPYLNDIQQIQKTIIDTALCYTQPTLSENEEGLSQSLWTLMIKELLKHSMTSPYRYLSGLLLLSELLPLPLPIQTKETLSDEELSLVVNNRKLWSAHLHPVTPHVHEVIQSLSVSSCIPLQQALRRVCWQIADLAAPSACIITKCVYEMLIDNLTASGNKEKGDEKKDGEKETPEEEEDKNNCLQVIKILSLLAYLLSHPSVKAAILCQLRSSSKLEDKNQDLLTLLIQLLNSSTTEKSSLRVQEQEQILTILQNLCDPEITLVSPDSSLSFQEQVWKRILITNLCFALTSSIVCVCVCVCVCLEKQEQVFYKLLTHLHSTYNKDSADFLQLLSAAIEFLRLLLAENSEEEGEFVRTYTLTVPELRKFINWTIRDECHPLYELEKLLEECAKEEETLDTLVESFSALIQLIEDNKAEASETKEFVEPVMPEGETLNSLFNHRALFVLTDSDDERLNTAYWMSPANSDDIDIELDLVRLNLQELVAKYCPEFNLEEELKKATDTTPYEGPPKPKRDRLGRRKSSEGVHFPRGKGTKQKFGASIRGRGASRGMASNRSDPFRSRPPNTSRPPSMHVDDFNKLQKTNQQLMGPAGLNRRPDKAFFLQEIGRGRGRGFDRNQGFSRGRFFTPPGNYRRNPGQFGHNTNKATLPYYPQNTRGGGSGGAGIGGGRGDGGGGRGDGGGGRGDGGGGRGDGGNSGSGMNIYTNRTNVSFNSPRQFIRGGLDKRTTVDRRTGRDNRFSLRGGGRGGNNLASGSLGAALLSAAVSGGAAGLTGPGGGVGNNAAAATASSSNHWFASKAKELDMRFQPTFRGRREISRHFRSFTK